MIIKDLRLTTVSFFLLLSSSFAASDSLSISSEMVSAYFVSSDTYKSSYVRKSEILFKEKDPVGIKIFGRRFLDGEFVENLNETTAKICFETDPDHQLVVPIEQLFKRFDFIKRGNKLIYKNGYVSLNKDVFIVRGLYVSAVAPKLGAREKFIKLEPLKGVGENFFSLKDLRYKMVDPHSSPTLSGLYTGRLLKIITMTPQKSVSPKNFVLVRLNPSEEPYLGIVMERLGKRVRAKLYISGDELEFTSVAKDPKFEFFEDEKILRQKVKAIVDGGSQEFRLFADKLFGGFQAVRVEFVPAQS